MYFCSTHTLGKVFDVKSSVYCDSLLSSSSSTGLKILRQQGCVHVVGHMFSEERFGSELQRKAQLWNRTGYDLKYYVF